MTLGRSAAPDPTGYVSPEIAGTGVLRTIGYWGVSVVVLLAYTGAILWILSSSTAKAYGFPVSHDLRTLIEISLQIGPMVAACFLVLLLPVKDRVIERLARSAQPAWRAAAGVFVSAATAIIAVCATAVAVLAACDFRPGPISAVTVLWVAGELAFDLTLVGVFTTTLHALTRRLWVTVLLFVAYTLVVVNVGPEWGITSYIGFGSGVPVMLTTYSTAPLYDGAAWLFRAYWTCVTLLMLAILYAFDRPNRALLTNVTDSVRGRAPGWQSAWYPSLALGAACIAVCASLVKLQDYGIAKYQAPPPSVLDGALQGDTATARLHLTHYSVTMNYRPDEAQVAIEGALTFRNGSEPTRTAYLQMPALMVPDRFHIRNAGDYQVVPLGKYVQVTFSNPLAPRHEATIEYRGSIQAAGAFDLAVQQKVLGGAFFLSDADVLITPRSAACLASSTAPCGSAENYLMSDQATGRISVVAPETFRVSSPGARSGRALGSSRFEHVFTIASPRLATFLVACAPFRESVAAGGAGVAIRVLRAPGAVADGDLEAPLAKKILSFYETAWPAYGRGDLNILEVPTPLGEAMAYEGTIAISDKIIASRSPISGTASNLLEFVMAHEIAHQWWGYGVVPTRTPGRQFVIESIPQFAAYKLLGHRGILSEQTARQNEERRYERGRTGLRNGEVALVRSETADEIAYNKGPFALLSLDQLSGGAMMDRLGALAASYSHQSHGLTSPEEFVASLVAELPEATRQTARRLLYEPGSDAMRRN